MHPEQKNYLAQLAQGDEKRYEDLEAAACYIMKCSAEFEEGSFAYKYYSELEAKGGSPELAQYRELLNNTYVTTSYDVINDETQQSVTVNKSKKLFDYDWSDSGLDFLNKTDNTYKVTIRGEGALNTVAGLGVIGASTAGGAASCAETLGAGCVIAIGTGGYGLDMALHGGAQMWTGERQYTFSAQLIEKITGLPKEDAEQILGLVSIAGTAASANKVLETAANQYKLTEAQIAALRTEAGIDSKAVGSNKPNAQANTVKENIAQSQAASGSSNFGEHAAKESALSVGDTTGKSLIYHENFGGHTIQRYVGKSDTELLDRFKTQPTLSASSTFTDMYTADKAIGNGIATHQAEITNWLGGTDGRLVIQHTETFDVGRVISNGAKQSHTTKGLTIVIDRDPLMPGGYRIQTAYPK